MANWKKTLLLGAAGLCLAGCGASQAQEEPAPDFHRLPLEAYRLDHRTEAAYHRAEALVVRACMSKAGFAWRVPSVTSPGPDPRRRRYGVADVGVARKYGYHPPQDDRSRSMEAIRAEQELFRRPGAEEAYSGPEGSEGQGCAARARERLTDGAGDADPMVFSALDEKSLERSERDPAVRAATRAWSECMRGRGHSYATPRDAVADGWDLERAVPSGKERAVASADAVCKEETGLTETWLRAEAGIQRGLVAGNASELAALKRANGVYRSNIRAVLEELDR